MWISIATCSLLTQKSRKPILPDHHPAPSRRDLLALIGASAGGSAMYLMMTALGHAAESTYTGPIRLEGDPKGASVLVLGAGVAGMVAAMELRRAGYNVTILEYNDRAGGRTWTIWGWRPLHRNGWRDAGLRLR